MGLSVPRPEYIFPELAESGAAGAARDALDRALALDPNLPEVHLARGYFRHQVERDFSGALSELQKAEQGLPNNADIFTAIAMIQRRRGRSDEAIEAARRAVTLDPRNRDACFFLATTYYSQRRFQEAIAVADRVLAFDPTDQGALNGKVYAYLMIGDLKAAEPLLANPGIEPSARGFYAFVQRNYPAAAEIFSKTTADDANRDWMEVFALGICQQRTGNLAAAQETFQGAIQGIQRELAQAHPDPLVQADLHGLLGVAYALLGEAAPAIAEGEKAIALKSTSEDSYDGPPVEETVAQIYAALGDADHAVPILKRLLQIPYGSQSLRKACELIHSGIRSATILAFRSWLQKSRDNLLSYAAELRAQLSLATSKPLS